MQTLKNILIHLRGTPISICNQYKTTKTKKHILKMIQKNTDPGGISYREKTQTNIGILYILYTINQTKMVTDKDDKVLFSPTKILSL